MTSLISTLLGTHKPANKPVKALSGSQRAMVDKSRARHLETIEKVYLAIQAGANTIAAIRAQTQLGQGAVINAIQALEMPHPTPRIKRFKTQPAHTFKALS